MSVLSVGAVSSEVVLARTFRERMVALRERMVGPTWRRLTGGEVFETAYRQVVPVALFYGQVLPFVAKGIVNLLAPAIGDSSILFCTAVTALTHLATRSVWAARQHANFQGLLAKTPEEPLLAGEPLDHDQKNLRAFVARRLGVKGFTEEMWGRISVEDSSTLTSEERRVLWQVGEGVEKLTPEEKATAREHVRGIGHYIRSGLKLALSDLPLATAMTWGALQVWEHLDPSEPGVSNILLRLTVGLCLSYLPSFLNAGRVNVIKGLGQYALLGAVAGEIIKHYG